MRIHKSGCLFGITSFRLNTPKHTLVFLFVLYSCISDNMARRAAKSDSSDDEAPEAFSFGQSKQAAKGEQNARQQFEAEQRRKLKQKNRERDRVLKERATQVKGTAKAAPGRKGKGVAREEDEDESADEGGSAPRDDLEARMERAMREAAEESGEEEEFSGFAPERESGDEDAASGLGEADEDEDEDGDGDSDLEGSHATHSDEDEDASDDGDEDEDQLSEGEDAEPSDEEDAAHERNVSNSDYLPDHLFKAAFSATAASSKRKANGDQGPQPPPKKRKRASRPGRDILVGYVFSHASSDVYSHLW